MNMEEIARKIASEAAYKNGRQMITGNDFVALRMDDIVAAVLKYAPLIAQQEREQCAEIADTVAKGEKEHGAEQMFNICSYVGRLIRARSTP